MFRNPHFAFAFLLLVTACSRDRRTPLVIYSPHGRDLLTLFEKRFEALHPDIDVRWLDMGSPDVFLYAEKVVPAAQAPQDWDDLLDPRWNGKIIIRDPLASGTMRAVFGLIVARGLKQTGDTAAGFAWLRRLDGQTKVYEQNPALISEKIARQEGLITIWDLPDVLISRRRGMPIGYVFPRSGTVAIEDGIAVVRGAKHLAAARAY